MAVFDISVCALAASNHTDMMHSYRCAPAVVRCHPRLALVRGKQGQGLRELEACAWLPDNDLTTAHGKVYNKTEHMVLERLLKATMSWAHVQGRITYPLLTYQDP